MEFWIPWCILCIGHVLDRFRFRRTLLLLLFSSTKFCDFGIPTILRVLNFAISQSRAKFCNFAQAKVKATLKSTGLANAAVSRLKLLQCKYMWSSCRIMWNMPHGAACTCYPVTTRNSHDHRYHQTSLSQARDCTGRKKRKGRKHQREWLCMFQNGKPVSDFLLHAWCVGTVIAQIFVRDLISYISYFWRKVRNLVAYENHTRMHVYLTPPSLYENF